MHRALVTGGGGFIGQALVRQLINNGVQVTILGRHLYPEIEKLGVRCLRGDIRDPALVSEACSRQDTVFHVAAKAGIWGAWKDYFSINVQGTANIVSVCREKEVERLIYTSTPSVVFDRNDLSGVNESVPYASRPLCHYATTKILAEKLVLAANGPELRTAAIRPHLVWGPGDNHLIPRLLARGQSGTLKIVGKGTNLVDIAYIDNVVDAHILAANKISEVDGAAGKAFFIGQEKPVVLWSWINDLYGRLGIPEVRKKVPFTVAYSLGWLLEMGYTVLGSKNEPPMTRFVAHQLAHSHWFSHERAHRILGYTPRISTDEGMKRLLDSIHGSTQN